MRLRYPLLIAVMACLSLSVSASRERRSLDTNWKFILEDQSMAQGVDFDDASWRTLDVPHDWAIEQPFSKENSSRNAYLPGGIAWYRKSFELAEKDGGKRVELQFDGVYKHAQVWVNGSFVGTQYDGYTSFHFDITDKLIVGEANVIAVRVDNSLQPNCRWYTGSGIYRHVWLNLTDPLHVENWGTFISTPTVTKSEALIRAVTTVTNEMSRPATFSLQTDVLNSQGDVVASVESSKQNVGAGLSFDV